MSATDDLGGLLPTDWDNWNRITSDSLNVDRLVGADGKELTSATFPEWCHKENQGPINSCAPNAGTTCVEGANFLKSGSRDQLSRWFAYIEGTKACGMFPADAGCTLDGVAEALKLKGAPLEKTVPYPARYDRNQTRFSADVYAEAALRRMAKTIDVSRGYEAWRACLGQGLGLVLLGVNWPFEYAIRNGYKFANHYRPRGRAGHAIAGVSLAESTDTRGRPDLWIANSHQGDEVYLVSATWVDELQSANPFGNLGLTDLTEPIPRRMDWLTNDSPFKR